ncbi:MAG: hypothetical protein F6K39_21535 [Okeania sp. SIO3B3]|nr:hypothetical protein [Okeania sp. SIO3B3]
MWKNIQSWKSIYSLLLALVLMSGSLVACEQTYSGQTSNPSVTPASSNKQRDLEKSFNDVEKTHNEFQELLDDFMNNIVKAIKDKEEREVVDSSKVNQKLTELETKVAEYRKQIFQPRNEENLEPIFNDINENIEKIRQITEPLKDGLGEEAIGGVQLDLEVIPNQENKFFGELGSTTEKRINESLTKDSERLKDKIIVLAQKEEIQKLNDKLQKILNELNQLKTLQPVLWIIVLALAVIILKPLFEESQPRRRKKLTEERNNTVNSTDNSDIQELIFKVDDKVEDYYEELEKMSKTWESEREKLKNQINQLQQNQQVKTQYNNNPDNKKLIFELENQVKEISRQLQEMSNWWNSQWRNLQNQQVRTPANLTGGHIESRRTTNYPPRQVTSEPQMNRHTSANQYSVSSGLQLISTYQQNPRLLSKSAIEVSETDQSIDQRRLGGGQGAILHKHRKGNYWIYARVVLSCLRNPSISRRC